MPQWHTKSKADLENTLANVVADLESQVDEDPPFSEVAGLEMNVLAAHAMEAIAGFQEANGASNPIDPTAAMQIYCMGFVVGKKYGESRVSESNAPLKE